MRKRAVTSTFIMLFLAAAVACQPRVSLWERMCESCHDGKTVLDGNVVMDKDQMKAKYKTMDELVKAVTCDSPSCMNIVKHDEKLVRMVGEELGLRELPKK